MRLRASKLTVWGVALVTIAAIGAGVHVYRERASYHWYHLLKLQIFGDVASQSIVTKYEIGFVPAEHVAFSAEESNQGFGPSWAFRPAHYGVPTYGVPIVDDTDLDGVPEVYVGSYTPELSVLDGRDGSLLWDWSLPFGVIGGRAISVADVDDDGEKDVVVGSHWTLPIRVYALRTAAGLASDQRLKWVRNVAGDFIESGLNVVHEGRSYVVAATRDAPYSRGSLNVIDGDGRFHYAPISGLDVCGNRIAVGPLGLHGETALVHGSHSFYGAEYGHKITARELSSGRLLWSTELPGDTGFQNHQIVDIDFDGRPEVVAFALTEPSNDSDLLGIQSAAFVLAGDTGAVKGSLDGSVFGVLPEKQLLLIGQEIYETGYGMTTRVSAVDTQGEVVYRLPAVSFGVRFAEDGRYRLVDIGYVEGQLVLDIYDAGTGIREHALSTPLSLPVYKQGSDYGIFGPPAQTLYFNTLADTDGDGNWNALVQIRDFIVDVQLPIKIHPSYDPSAPIAFRNSDNNGKLY